MRSTSAVECGTITIDFSVTAMRLQLVCVSCDCSEKYDRAAVLR